MIDEKKYKKALDYAIKKHKGQYRIGGAPYIVHPIAVADFLRKKGYSTEYLITALFHDLLEDTDATEQEIKDIGGEEVLQAVKILTKYKGYVMSEYIDKIKLNKIAFTVKCADRLDNVNGLKYTSEDFRKKYIRETEEWYNDFSEEINLALKQYK